MKILKRKRGASPLRSTQSEGMPTSSRWRRVNALLMLVALAAVAYVLGTKALKDQQFPLRQVYFQGQLQQLTEADLRQVVSSYLGRNFFTLNIDNLSQDLSALPWVKQVTVRRLWPDSLEVWLHEHQAYAYWGQDELVDDQGQRFRPKQLPQFNLPQLHGPDSQEEAVMEAYQIVSDLLQAVNLRPKVLIQDERGAWTLRLDNGLAVLLGKYDLQQRLQRLVAVYPSTLESKVSEIAELDLRYQSGIAVRWTTLSEPNQAVRTAANSSKSSG